MCDLNHQPKRLCRRNRDVSHATQRDRERMLSLIADQLHALGFRGMNTRSLKPKHIEALLEQWQREDLSVGTIKNRMAALRWRAQKVDRGPHFQGGQALRGGAEAGEGAQGGMRLF